MEITFIWSFHIVERWLQSNSSLPVPSFPYLEHFFPSNSVQLSWFRTEVLVDFCLQVARLWACIVYSNTKELILLYFLKEHYRMFYKLFYVNIALVTFYVWGFNNNKEMFLRGVHSFRFLEFIDYFSLAANTDCCFLVLNISCCIIYCDFDYLQVQKELSNSLRCLVKRLFYCV